MCSDDRGADFMLVAIKSIFINNADDNIAVHVITDGFSAETLNGIDRLGRRFDRRITVHTADLTGMDDLPEVHRPGVYIPRTMYLRLMLDKILPEEISRVIYLDTDTIVENSLRELWETDLEEYVMGAVTDVNLATDEHFSRLGLDNATPYFNSGMLLIDMTRYREGDIRRQCLDWLGRNKAIADYPDQDALNVILRGRILPLHPRYNVFDSYFRHVNYGSRFVCPADWDDAVSHPSIIHYTGLKPWLRYYPAVHIPARERFHHYRRIIFRLPIKKRPPVGNLGVVIRGYLRKSAALGWLYRISPSFWGKIAAAMTKTARPTSCGPAETPACESMQCQTPDRRLNKKSSCLPVAIKCCLPPRILNLTQKWTPLL